MKKIYTILLLLFAFTAKGQTYLATNVNGVYANSSGGVTLSASVDSTSLNAGGDSLIVYKNLIRYAYILPAGGGGGGVTSVATTDSTGINGGTITTTGTLSLDTTRVVVSKRYLDSKLASVGGGWVLLSTTTISNNATVDYTIDSTAGWHKIWVSVADYIPATDNTALYVRIGTGGTPTYQSGALDYLHFTTFAGNLASSSTSSTGAPQLQVAYSIDNGYSCEADIYIARPSESGTYKTITWNAATHEQSNPTAGMYTWRGTGYYKIHSGRITGVQILSSSGNITSGTVKIYGIK